MKAYLVVHWGCDEALFLVKENAQKKVDELNAKDRLNRLTRRATKKLDVRFEPAEPPPPEWVSQLPKAWFLEKEIEDYDEWKEGSHNELFHGH